MFFLKLIFRGLSLIILNMLMSGILKSNNHGRKNPSSSLSGTVLGNGSLAGGGEGVHNSDLYSLK